MKEYLIKEKRAALQWILIGLGGMLIYYFIHLSGFIQSEQNFLDYLVQSVENHPSRRNARLLFSPLMFLLFSIAFIYGVITYLKLRRNNVRH